MKLVDAVYLTEHGTKVGVEKGALTIKAPDRDRLRIPLEAIEQIVIVCRAQMSDEALARCARRGIRVAALTKSGRLRYAMEAGESGNVHLRVAQVRAFDDPAKSLEIARPIIGAKIANSRSAVIRWSWDSADTQRNFLASTADGLSARLAKAQTCADLDTLRGIEGDAARLYFKAVGNVLNGGDHGFTFDSRSRRPPRTPTNALLSFGYGLLSSEMIGALNAAGLDHQIGFLHRLRPGRPSLALDLIEELRSPIVDRFIVGAIRNRKLRLTDLEELPGGAWQLTGDGRRRFFGHWEEFRRKPETHIYLDRPVERWALPTTQALLLARHLRGDIDTYPPWIRTP